METELRGMSKQAKQIIDYLNRRTKGQLEEMKITNRIRLIKVVKKMIMKQTLMKRTQNNIRELVDDITSFKIMFNEVTNLGPPHLWDGNR